ncbi:MAG: hypothetical protein OSJ27_03005 [Candidatus Gastranaerophilales bacterium]|nr:hypothetical protein [Candidatus Gastranaerophilales bacterium]
MKILGIYSNKSLYRNTSALKQQKNTGFGAHIHKKGPSRYMVSENGLITAAQEAQILSERKRAELEARANQPILTKEQRRAILEEKYLNPDRSTFGAKQEFQEHVLSQIQEELKDFPDIKRQFFLTPDKTGRIPVARPINDIYSILKMFEDAPETIKDMLLTKDNNGNLPIHNSSYHGAAIISALKNQPQALAQMLTAQNNNGNNALHNFLEEEHSSIDRAYFTEEKSKLINFLLDSVKDQPDVVRKMMTAKNNKGEVPLNVSNSDTSLETRYAMMEAVKDDPDTLITMLLTPDNNGLIYSDKYYISQEMSARLREWLKDSPDTLKQIYTHKNPKDGELPAHWADTDCTKAILDTFKNDPETLKSIFLTKDNNGRLPVHYPVEFTWWINTKGRTEEISKAFKDDFDTLRQMYLTKDNDGNLPLHYAEYENIKSIIDLFKDEPKTIRTMVLSENNEGRIPVCAKELDSSSVLKPTIYALSDFPELRDEMCLKASTRGLFGRSDYNEDIAHIISMEYHNKPEILAQICLNAFPLPKCESYNLRPRELCDAVKNLATNSGLSSEKSVELLELYSAYEPEFQTIADCIKSQQA